MPIIINGGSYSAGDWWSSHLQKAETNERVEIVGFTNLSAETIPDAFREMEALAAGTRCKNYFYQANINPRADEHLTPAQRDEAIETLETNLGFTGQPRFVVEHQKEGRTHWHVVWSRIDTENMRAIPDSLTAAIHERTSRELEIKFDLERGQSILVPNRDLERPPRRPKKSEAFRAVETGVDLETVKADAQAARQQADNGQSFRAALEASGDYVLARGDRRDFVIIDRTGDDHSLARRLGIKAAEVRAYMADIDPASLPSVDEAKALQAERRAHEISQEPRPQPEPPQIEKAAAKGPYAELGAAQTESQFAAAAERMTAPRPETFDRDADQSAWLDAVAQAAIESALALDATQKAKDGQEAGPDVEARRGAARGMYAQLQTPEPAPEPTPETAPVAAASQAIGIAGGFLGGAAKIVAEIGDFLGGLFGGPKPTRQQAHEAAQARGNEETLQAHDYAASVQAKEAEFDERMHAQKTADQQQDLSFYQRYGAPPTREANLGRDHDNERERERERERD